MKLLYSLKYALPALLFPFAGKPLTNKYHVEDILIHKFAYGLHSVLFYPVDSNYYDELQKRLDAAKAVGKYQWNSADNFIWKNLAEGVQNGFIVNTEEEKPGGRHNCRANISPIWKPVRRAPMQPTFIPIKICYR